MNIIRDYKLYIAFLLIVSFFTFSQTSKAAVFNVTNAAELRAALLTAQSNGETDFINLAAEAYNTGGVPFTYTASLFENFGLNISGSGTAFSLLEGSTQTAVLIIDTTAVLGDFNVNINIDSLSITQGSTAAFSGFAGGLTILSDNGNVMMEDCNFSFNTGGMSGGAYIDTLGQISISNSDFFENTSLTSNGGGALLTGNFILLTDNLFEENSTNSVLARGGGLSASALATNGGDPANGTMILNGNVFSENDSEGHGGASLTAAFGAALQGNGFVDNTAGEAGAGGLFINVVNTDPGDTMQNTLLTELFSNLFQGNSSTGGNAGGAEVIAGIDIIMVNNIFLQNTAESAGGALLDAPDIIATNNTFTLNNANGGLASGDGGGMLLFVTDDTTGEIYNNIVYDNSATGFGADIFVDDDTDNNQIGSTVDLMFNDFSDFFSVCENNPPCVPDVNTMGNIDRNPRFVNAQQGDVNLQRNSPARRAGDDMAPQLPSSDAVGNPLGDPPDMGALQFVGGGGGSGSCSLAYEDSTRSGLFNSLALLILPLAYLLVLGIRRKSATPQ